MPALLCPIPKTKSNPAAGSALTHSEAIRSSSAFSQNPAERHKLTAYTGALCRLGKASADGSSDPVLRGASVPQAGFRKGCAFQKNTSFFLFVFKGSNASRACSIALPALSEHLKAQRLKPNTATFYLHSLRRKLIFGKAIGYPQSVCQHLPLKCFLC